MKKVLTVIMLLFIVQMIINDKVFGQIQAQAEKSKESKPFVFPAFPKYGKTLEDFTANGWEIKDTITGDLNKDKIADAAIILEYRDSVINEARVYGDTTVASPRILLIVFKSGDHYELKLQHNTFILRDGEMGDGDPYESMVISKGVLYLNFQNYSRGGAIELHYLIRYQLNDFYLIGATDKSYSDGGGYSSSDFNFSTRKYIYESGNLDGRIDEREQKILPLHVLKKLSELSEPLTWKVFELEVI